MAELQHNQIRLYPFDAEENDDEELQLNTRIRVSSAVLRGFPSSPFSLTPGSIRSGHAPLCCRRL